MNNIFVWVTCVISIVFCNIVFANTDMNPGPKPATLTLPSGLIQEATPTYTWNQNPNADWYRLFIWDSAKKKIHSQWYDSSNICSNGACAVTLKEKLGNDHYKWWVKSWNNNGSAWSDGMQFAVQKSGSRPLKIQLTSPSGTTDSRTPTLTWKKDPYATWYKLDIKGTSNAHKFVQWYEIEDHSATYPQVSCSENECSVTLESELASGNYEWSIKGWNTSGNGGWSDRMQLTVDDLFDINLKQFESSEDLNEFLKQSLEVNARRISFFEETADTVAPGLVYSETNLQVKGVDELDTIKFDGKYLFISPVNDHLYNPDKLSAIRIMELSSTETIERARITLENHEKDVDGFYLVRSTGENDPDLLVTIGGKSSDMWQYWCYPWYWTEGKTEIVIYDVTVPLESTKKTALQFDGDLISSRRIENKLYIVTRFTPTIPGLNIDTNNQTKIEENKALLEKTPINNILPSLTIDGVNKGSFIRAEQCYFSTARKIIHEQPTMITITMIDLGAPENPVSQSIVGSTETVYVSNQSLYIATTKYNYSQYEESDSQITTEIHKFKLGEEGPEYRATASVGGHLGWEEDKKSFRMSEYNDVFRIATSVEDSWNGTESTTLTLFQEELNGSDTILSKTASIKGIGKIGEKLYSARFLGTKAYLVTFRVTDPLYVFDLSDPQNPLKLGELHIEGYSNYLHPVSEDLLLGIGKDAVPDQTSDDFGGRGAWYQGVKLSLFDVSDPGDPQEVQSLILGKRGTSSDLLYDHHSLAYLPPTADRGARLAIPIELHDTEPASDYFDPETPWAYYSWTHTGLYLFEIETRQSPELNAGIKKTGEIIIGQSGPQADYYYNFSNDRALLLNDRVHYIHDAQVWSSDWNSSSGATGPH